MLNTPWCLKVTDRYGVSRTAESGPFASESSQLGLWGPRAAARPPGSRFLTVPASIFVRLLLLFAFSSPYLFRRSTSFIGDTREL